MFGQGSRELLVHHFLEMGVDFCIGCGGGVRRDGLEHPVHLFLYPGEFTVSDSAQYHSWHGLPADRLLLLLLRRGGRFVLLWGGKRFWLLPLKVELYDRTGRSVDKAGRRVRSGWYFERGGEMP